MDHESVVANRIVERYVLNELDETGRDAFEEHYFQCAVCGDEVRSASAFIANARAVLAEPEAVEETPPVQERRGWSLWMRPAWGLALTLTLALFTGYQAVVIRNLGTVRQISPFVLIPETRGNARTLDFRPGAPLLFAFQIPSGTAASYEAEIVRVDTGAVIDKTPVMHPADGEPAHVLFPKPRLQPGAHALILRATDGPNRGAQIDRYPFEVPSR